MPIRITCVDCKKKVRVRSMKGRAMVSECRACYKAKTGRRRPSNSNPIIIQTYDR